MNSKSRLIVSLITFFALFVFFVVACLTWFLYLRYAIFSNINGQFKANKVLGEVNANVIYAGNFYNMTIDGDPEGSKKIVYDGNEVAQTTSFRVPGKEVFQLSKRFNYLILEYKFTNKSPSDEWLVSMVAEFPTKNNVVITSAYFADEGVTDYSLVDNPFDNEFIKSVPVSTNGVLFVYLKIQIEDLEKDADFEANMNWTLNSRDFLDQNPIP